MIEWHACKKGTAYDMGLSLEECLRKDVFLERCQFSGIRLDYDKRDRCGAKMNSASFDRIQPGGPYSLANVQIVALSINTMKGNFCGRTILLLLDALEHLETLEYFETHIPPACR